jgi:hypothetical protein
VRLIVSLYLISLIIPDLYGQKDSLRHRNDTLPESYYLLPKVNREGVNLPEVEIKEVTIVARPPGAARRSEFRKYERLVFNIKKVYPYAIVVRNRLRLVNEDLKNISDEKQRKAYIKGVEKGVLSEYSNDIQELNITQGRLLIKLIDRETQNTSYQLIREYRGKFSAGFWQGIARIFGTNLKEEYDPYGEDYLIEFIIREVEAGRL